MGAWIEILFEGFKNEKEKSHPTMGAWIEIAKFRNISHDELGRTPRWVRGLK